MYESIKAEKRGWLRAVVSSAFMQRFLQHQASWGRHTFALNQEITSASKAWEHPGQIMLSPPETWSQSTETLVTRWQTSCFLGHLCQAMPSHIMDSPKKKDANKYKVILTVVVFRPCVTCQHPYPVELFLKRGTWPKMLCLLALCHKAAGNKTPAPRKPPGK